MKTILVDAVYTLVSKEGEIFKGMHNLLESYPNDKIVLTNANDEEFEKFGLDKVPYKIFTLKHNPDKTDPKYYKLMLTHFTLKPDEVVYFEHSKEACESAKKVGIRTYFYDNESKDLGALKEFLDISL